MTKPTEQFISSYRREQDFFHAVASRASELVSHRLRQQGVQAIVTSRAKDFDRLKEKLATRNKSYKTEEDVYKDIIDLAGVRIALYFPGDLERVMNTISEIFTDLKIIEHPKAPRTNLVYEAEFKGYKATHVNCRIKPENLNEAEQRYSSAAIEIQIASVLMHAWAEVEHDLIYKQQSGSPSIDEYMIVDEINGLVLSAEIALKRLQKAIKNRAAQEEREFKNHYELAAFIMQAVADSRTPLGRIDTLYDLLKQVGWNNADRVSSLVKSLSLTNSEIVAQELTDTILESFPDQDLLKFYHKSRASRDNVETTSTLESTATDNAIGKMLKVWNRLEKLIRSKSNISENENRSFSDIIRGIGLDTIDLNELNYLRSKRNYVVHSIKLPPVQEIQNLTNRMEMLLVKLNSISVE